MLELSKKEGVVVEVASLYTDHFSPSPRRPNHLPPYLPGHIWQQQLAELLKTKKAPPPPTPPVTAPVPQPNPEPVPRRAYSTRKRKPPSSHSPPKSKVKVWGSVVQ